MSIKVDENGCFTTPDGRCVSKEPCMHSVSALTGNRRFREVSMGTENSYLLLQVEVTEWVSSREDKPGRWVCIWRDATPADVQSSEMVGVQCRGFNGDCNRPQDIAKFQDRVCSCDS